MEEKEYGRMILGERISIPRERKPDRVRIMEINEALKDKSGRLAKKLIVKYEEDENVRRVLKWLLR